MLYSWKISGWWSKIPVSATHTGDKEFPVWLRNEVANARSPSLSANFNFQKIFHNSCLKSNYKYQGWHCDDLGKADILYVGIPPGHQLVSQLLHFWSSFSVYGLVSSRGWWKCSGPCHSCGRFGRNSLFLVSAWSSPDCVTIWWVKTQMDNFCLLPLTLLILILPPSVTLSK